VYRAKRDGRREARSKRSHALRKRRKTAAVLGGGRGAQRERRREGPGRARGEGRKEGRLGATKGARTTIITMARGQGLRVESGASTARGGAGEQRGPKKEKRKGRGSARMGVQRQRGGRGWRELLGEREGRNGTPPSRRFSCGRQEQSRGEERQIGSGATAEQTEASKRSERQAGTPPSGN